jgi:hypothetical protein
MYDKEDDEELVKWYSHTGVDFVMTKKLRNKKKDEEHERLIKMLELKYPDEE